MTPFLRLVPLFQYTCFFFITDQQLPCHFQLFNLDFISPFGYAIIKVGLHSQPLSIKNIAI